MFSDMQSYCYDSVDIDNGLCEYYSVENGEGKLTILDEQLADEEYGIAFKKGNQQLADQILGALDELVKDGTAAQISQKWFGEDRIIFQYQK